MQLKDIMTKQVVTINGEDNVADAAKRMLEADIGCLVVTNASTIKGIITDRDLTIGCLSEGHNPRQCQVAHHMTSPVVTASSATDVLEAAHLMTEKKIKRLPVTERGQLTGLVSFLDIAQAMEGPMHDLMIGMGAARRID